MRLFDSISIKSADKHSCLIRVRRVFGNNACEFSNLLEATSICLIHCAYGKNAK